jgi:hypothetical protein
MTVISVRGSTKQYGGVCADNDLTRQRSAGRSSAVTIHDRG